MRLLYEVVDDEHYLEIVITPEEVDRVGQGYLIYKPDLILKRHFNVAIRVDKGDENAVEERNF